MVESRFVVKSEWLTAESSSLFHDWEAGNSIRILWFEVEKSYK